MDKILSKKGAVEFLKLDEKTFDNYFKSAGEFKHLPRQNGRGRFLFNQIPHKGSNINGHCSKFDQIYYISKKLIDSIS